MKRILSNENLYLPISNVELQTNQVYLIERKDLPIKRREPNTHKGCYGRIKIIAGSSEMMGASMLCYESALATLRCGAGLVTLCVPSSLREVYQVRVKESMLYFMDDNNGKVIFNSSQLDEIMDNTSTIVIGMGMGKNSEILKIIDYLLHHFTGTIVIDADGINSIQHNTDVLLNKTCKCVLTPHVVEFERLNGGDASILERVKEFCNKYNVVVVYKSAHSLISDGEHFYINTTGSPCMAKAGSGDILGGMVGAFCNTMPPLQAGCSASYFFGKAGEKARDRLNSDISVLASDIIIEIAKQ